MRGSGRFTERATGAIGAARDAAAALGHSYVGTEHLLLGVAAETEGLGARVLERYGLDTARLTRLVAAECGRGAPGEPAQGLTPNARAVIEQAARDARRLGHGYVGHGTPADGRIALAGMHGLRPGERHRRGAGAAVRGDT